MKLGITLGDCAGIGPEIVARAVEACSHEVSLRIYGPRPIWERACRLVGVADPISVWQDANEVVSTDVGVVGVDVPLTGDLTPGQIQATCGATAVACVTDACKAALRGEIDGLVTAPLCKESMHLAGVHFDGHTDLLEHLCGAPVGQACMVFSAPHLVLGLATIHVAIDRVAQELSAQKVEHAIVMTTEAVKRLRGIERPRIAVLALNPHAGEHGAFGSQEAEVITPVIEKLQKRLMVELVGPVVADTAFTWLLAHPNNPPYDGVVAMYHDQGLIPFKALAFNCGVNMTLGLPVVRTSPDHGTAFDLAWQGRASHHSMVAAIQCAQRLVATRQD